MNEYEKIEVVEKGVDEIVEVEKFNPFHDAAGKFSNKNGFKSYSANPNTKAGAMAIARSAAAGHGTTMNVHRDATSTGPTIRHNANWLGSGNQSGNSRWQGSATLRNRVEPGYGLKGAATVGSQWQQSNASRGRTTAPGKQPAQQPQQQAQKPAPAKQPQTQQPQQNPAQQPQQPQQQGLADRVKNVQLRQGDKLAIVPRDGNGHTTNNTNAVAKNHDQRRVAGTDISDTVDVTKIKGGGAAIDKIARAQGWNKAPTVTDDIEVFQKAAKQSGQILIRSIRDGGGKAGQDIWSDVLTNGDAPLGGSGAQWYGAGMYCVGAKTTGATGRNLGRTISAAQTHSYGYGSNQMMATVHPSAKIATPKQAAQLQSDYYRLSSSQQRKYGGYGEYIASKGYDGAQWHDRSNCPYITMYNKSAMIFYNGMSKS